jgi:hypothetical protein
MLGDTTVSRLQHSGVAYLKQCFLAVVIGCATLYAYSLPPPSGFGGIHLLDGYSAQRVWAVDARVWEIKGPNHFLINFEAGNESWATPKDIRQYAWYREISIHGHKVRLALVKSGLKTQWEPEHNRNLPLGNVLLVSYELWKATKLYPEHSANFSAKVADQGELADALLMILTFDPSREDF